MGRTCGVAFDLDRITVGGSGSAPELRVEVKGSGDAGRPAEQARAQRRARVGAARQR